MSQALDVKLDTADLRKVYADLKAANSSLTVELRRGVKNAAAPLANAVKVEASWSTRIPGAVKTKATFTARKTSVSIYVDPKMAPEAAPLNHGDRGGTFRRPVFADADEERSDWTWVSQQARPFMLAAIQPHFRDADVAMAKVLDTIARKAGFR